MATCLTCRFGDGLAIYSGIEERAPCSAPVPLAYSDFVARTNVLLTLAKQITGGHAFSDLSNTVPSYLTSAPFGDCPFHESKEGHA